MLISFVPQAGKSVNIYLPWRWVCLKTPTQPMFQKHCNESASGEMLLKLIGKKYRRKQGYSRIRQARVPSKTKMSH